MPLNPAAVLAAFDEQVRRSLSPDGTGATFEADGFVVRRLALPGRGGSGIFWSALDARTADGVIAAHVDFFARRREEFEWKLYDYDGPADLAGRLLAAGFAPEPAESLMIASVAEVREALSGAIPPPGVRVEPVTDGAGVDLLAEVHESVFHADESELRESLRAQLATAPELIGPVLAMAGELPVAAARVEFTPDCEFAGLWGGGTLAAWRGRGVYRALVRYRADLAAERGRSYLSVDASDQSRPVLERVGFTCFATTTPYVWSPE